MSKRAFLPAFCCLLIFCGEQAGKDAAIIVEEKAITRKQVEEAAEMIHRSMVSMFPQKALEGVSPELLKGAARQLIANELMLKEARKRDLSFDTAMVDSAFAQFKSRFGDQATFERELTMMGQTEKSVRQEMQNGALVDTLLKIILNECDSVKDEECRSFYEQNKARYLNPPRSRVSQIFFPSDTAKAVQEKKRAEASAVLAKIKGGSDFSKLAAKYSGGDLGWFKRGDLKAELDTVIGKLKLGEVSEIVTTGVGFHILKKTEEEPGKPLSYEEVKDHIRINLEMQQKNVFVADFVDKLISKAKIRYNDTSLVYVAPADSMKK